MAIQENTITTEEMNVVLDQEFIANFNQEFERFAEILGLFDADVARAGEALYQVKVTGTLEQGATEGEAATRSKYEVDKTPVGSINILRYEKASTIEAIQKSGVINAVTRTDDKALKELRSKILDDFFTFMGNAQGHAEATGDSLQAVLAKLDAAIYDELEDANDGTERIIHFVNRADIADYLAAKDITLQTMFGVNYLADFLGITDIIITNKIPAGTVYATPVENIHVFGVDFSAFASAGIPYAVQDRGLVGVHHAPDYRTGSVVTYIAKAASFFPEAANYIGIGTIGSSPSPDPEPEVNYQAVDKTQEGYANMNPTTEGWYERSGESEPYTYTLSEDTEVNENKTYYEIVA